MPRPCKVQSSATRPGALRCLGYTMLNRGLSLLADSGIMRCSAKALSIQLLTLRSRLKILRHIPVTHCN